MAPPQLGGLGTCPLNTLISWRPQGCQSPDGLGLTHPGLTHLGSLPPSLSPTVGLLPGLLPLTGQMRLPPPCPSQAALGQSLNDTTTARIMELWRELLDGMLKSPVCAHTWSDKELLHTQPKSRWRGIPEGREGVRRGDPAGRDIEWGTHRPTCPPQPCPAEGTVLPTGQCQVPTPLQSSLSE